MPVLSRGPRRALHALLLFLAAFGSLGLQCGWGSPLEPLSTHCPPRTIDCGPGCIEEGTSCCDDRVNGGLSQCPTAGKGVGQACIPRGVGTCPAGGTSKFCCGETAIGGATPSTDISPTITFSGFPGVFCGTKVIAGGDECCSSDAAGKKLCRFTSPRTAISGAGGGGGGSTGGGSGGGPPSCSNTGPGFIGSARTCLASGATCSCNTASTNRCITKEEFDAIARPFPAACKPSGQTGCIETTSSTLIAPCCAGLACKVSAACGSAASGGTCLP